MANLIIKSSANDLVIQGSDESPAITVGTTGTTTFAENATLSGSANALGTVTTGNISNTAIVYPAGHILKTYQKVFSGVQNLAGTNADNILIGTGASGSDGDPLVITTDIPASSSSKYLITATVHQSRSQDGGVMFRLRSATNTSTIIESAVATGVQTNATFGRSHPSTLGNAGNYGMSQTGIVYLWSPDSGAAQTIGVYGHNYNSSTNVINRGDNNDNGAHTGHAISTLTVQEVAG